MRRLSLSALTAAAAVVFSLVGAAAQQTTPVPPDVDALLQHLDDLYRSKSSVARIQIDVTTTRSTRNLRLRAWTRGEEEVLVLIEAPPRETGTATLRVGNNLWNYLPKILSRHAIGVTGSYEASPEFSYSGQWLHNPHDGSGIVAPALTYAFNDAVSLLGSVYLPYGEAPEGGRLRSEYGAAPLSGLLQLRLYF